MCELNPSADARGERFPDRVFDLPLDADGHQCHDGGVERHDEHISLELTERQPEQPAPPQHEQHNLRDPEQHDEEVSQGQVHYEQVRHGSAHLLFRHYYEHHQRVSDQSYDTCNETNH